MKLTLREAKEVLKDVAGISGMKVTDKNLPTVINRAAQELVESGDFPELVDQYIFKLHDSFLVLPYFLEKATHVAVDQNPIELRSPWFEFMQHGPGIIEPSDTWHVLLERNNIPTFRNVPNTGGPWKVKITAEVDESTDGVEPIFHLRGYDENNVERYSTLNSTEWGRGEDLIISKAAGFTTTSSFNWSNITQIVKPVTKGRIFLDVTDGITDIRIGEYAPEERSPSNRVYLLPGVADCNNETDSSGLRTEVDLVIRAKKRFVKALDDNDELQITSINALESMIIAQTKRRNQKVEEYAQMRGVAIGLMTDKSNSTEQRTKRPLLSFTRTAGFNYPNIR